MTIMRVLLLLSLISGSAVLVINARGEITGGGTSELFNTDEHFFDPISEINVFLPIVDGGCSLCEWTAYGAYDDEFSFNSQKFSFDNAVSVCDKCGGKIINARNESEFDFTRRVLEHLGQNGAPYWLDVYYVGGQLRGSDGNPQDFTKWANTEPDGADGDYTNVTCVTVNGSGKWKDRGCGHVQFSICHRPAGTIIPMAPECVPTDIETPPPLPGFTTTSDECDMKNWEPYVSADGGLYEFGFNNDKLSFSQAEATCGLCGAGLVTVKSEEEYNFIQTVVVDLGKQDASFWLGATDIEEEGEWRWLDGDRVNETHSHWSSAEPDNMDNNSPNADCMIVSNRGVWRDWDCDNPKKSLCRRRVPPSSIPPPTPTTVTPPYPVSSTELPATTTLPGPYWPSYPDQTTYPSRPPTGIPYYPFTTSFFQTGTRDPYYVTTTTPSYGTAQQTTDSPNNHYYQYGNSGNLTSRNWPQRYSPNEDYNITVTLQGSGPFTVNFDIVDFDLEYSPTCFFDYLMLYFGDESTDRFCSRPSDNETTVVVPGNSFTVHFHSDYSMEGTGFFVSYNAVPQQPEVTLPDNVMSLLQELNVEGEEIMSGWGDFDRLLRDRLDAELNDYRQSLLADLTRLLQELNSQAEDLVTALNGLDGHLGGYLGTDLNDLQIPSLEDLTSRHQENCNQQTAARNDVEEVLDVNLPSI